jgi:hypothetical protein
VPHGSSPLTVYTLMSQCQDGTVRGDLGLTEACRRIVLSTANLIMDVKSNQRVAVVQLLMIQLRIVKTKEEEENILQEANKARGEDEQTEDDELHGTMVIKYLVEPWSRRRPRVVCADSYIASVRTAEALYQLNLRLIGVVKTATKRFPMEHFCAVVM